MPSNLKDAGTNGGVTGSSASANATTILQMFRTKTLEMKTWKPRNIPSSRDRLELYSLHKQAVSGDAPLTNASSQSSAQDLAKYNAWKSKRGLSKQEAMNFYIIECDRQIRTYGTLTAEQSNPQTPTNTPSAEQSTERGSAGGGGSPTRTTTTTPARGLAAVPLLCAAATETRKAYLSRLQSTSSEQGGGWWSKQEPLSLNDTQSLLAFPEKSLILLGQLVESFSLYLQTPTSLMKEFVPFVSPSVIQAWLWPFHNMLLALWVWLILAYTTCQSIFSTINTIVFGSTHTKIPLEAIYHEDLLQMKELCDSLTDQHQALSVRLVGLALWPWNVLVLQTIVYLVDMIGLGLLPALTAYVLISIMGSAWYWFFVLPTLAFWSLITSFWIGMGYSLIELAGM